MQSCLNPTETSPLREVDVKKKPKTKFSWCPVCMVHTYHKKINGKWCCTDWNHDDFLRFRNDPWIDDYRRAKLEIQLPVSSKV